MFLNCNLSVNSHAPALRFSSSLPVILWRLLADEPGPATLQSHHLYSARERKEFQEIFWGELVSLLLSPFQQRSKRDSK